MSELTQEQIEEIWKVIWFGVLHTCEEKCQCHAECNKACDTVEQLKKKFAIVHRQEGSSNEQIEQKAKDEAIEIITDVLYSIQTEKGSHLLTTDLCDDTAEQIIKDLVASGYTLAKQEQGEENYDRGVKDGKENILNRTILLLQKDYLSNLKEISESSRAIRNYQKKLIDVLKGAEL